MASMTFEEWQVALWRMRRLAAHFGPGVQARLNPPPYLVSLASPQFCPSVTCWLPSCALHPYHPIDKCLHFNNHMDATERAAAIVKDHRCWTCFEPTDDPELHCSRNCTTPRGCPCGSAFHQQPLHGAQFVTTPRL